MEKLIKFAMLIVLVVCFLSAAYTMGYKANNEPMGDFIEINDISGQYRIARASIYDVKQIKDEYGISYYVRIQSIHGVTTIEFVDTIIEDQLVLAEDLKESFLMALRG